MGDFGKAMGYSAGGLFFDQPPRTLMTDPRTGYQRAEEARRIAYTDALARQYADAQRDPMWGTGTDPVAQKYMEQQLIDSVYNQLGAAGSLGSGTSQAAAAKALADYRLGLLQRRNQALEKLRSDMIGAASVGGTPYVVTPVEGKESTVKAMAKSMAGSMMGGMGV
jgi:hypothetical protein